MISAEWNATGMGGWRSWVGPAIVALALAVCLAWARAGARSWVAAADPVILRLQDGNLLEFESTFYYGLIDTMRGVPHGGFAFSTDSYRTWLNSYLAAVLYSWTGSIYWSFAAIDLFGWWLSALATFSLALRFGIGRTGAWIATLAYTLSPAAVALMWVHTLHVFASASIAPLLWLTERVLRTTQRQRDGGERDPTFQGEVPLAAGLLLIWYGASLVYQYHLSLIPLTVLWLALIGAPLRRYVGWLAAVVAFVALTVLTRQLFDAVGIQVEAAVNDPFAALVGRARAAAIVGEPLSLVVDLARSALTTTARAFHPVVAVLGVIGLMMCSDPLRKLGLASLVLAAAQAAIVPRPHVAFTAVPAIYLGLGRLLTAPSLGLSKPAGRVVPNQMRRQAWAHNAVRAVALGAIMWLTNQDLVGDYSFVWTYWGQYAR